MGQNKPASRGITFGRSASGEARALSIQVARTLSVQAVWTEGGTRLVITGPAVAVDAFFSFAVAALRLTGGQPPAQA